MAKFSDGGLFHVFYILGKQFPPSKEIGQILAGDNVIVQAQTAQKFVKAVHGAIIQIYFIAIFIPMQERPGVNEKDSGIQALWHTSGQP